MAETYGYWLFMSAIIAFVFILIYVVYQWHNDRGLNRNFIFEILVTAIMFASGSLYIQSFPDEFESLLVFFESWSNSLELPLARLFVILLVIQIVIALRMVWKITYFVLGSGIQNAKRWFRYMRFRICEGCRPRLDSRCTEADYVFVESLKYSIFALPYKTSLWAEQCPVVDRGIVHVCCRKHPDRCVNCRMKVFVFNDDPERILFRTHWPVPPEDCDRSHQQQQFTALAFLSTPRLCPRCSYVPYFSMSLTLTDDEMAKKNKLLAWGQQNEIIPSPWVLNYDE